jgi:aminoglycoside phosphotransferase (APT) family kinase protein
MSQKKKIHFNELDEYRLQLEQDFPELTIRTLRRIGNGWDHIALEVNDEIIFRMPEDGQFDDEQRKLVAYETAVLRKLQPVLPIAIPEPLYIPPHGGYFGYPKLEGILAEEAWPKLTPDQQTKLQEDWVTIVTAIERALPVEEAQRLGVPPFWLQESIRDIHGFLQRENISPEHRQFAERTLERAKQLDVNKNPFFLHNDFYLHNMLLDPQTKRLKALLDWSDCCTAPIEREFTLWHWLPDAQFDAIIELYTQRTGRSVNKEQVKVWSYVDAFSDLNTQLLEGDQPGIEKSLQHINRWLQEEI